MRQTLNFYPPVSGSRMLRLQKWAAVVLPLPLPCLLQFCLTISFKHDFLKEGSTDLFYTIAHLTTHLSHNGLHGTEEQCTLLCLRSLESSCNYQFASNWDAERNRLCLSPEKKQILQDSGHCGLSLLKRCVTTALTTGAMASL